MKKNMKETYSKLKPFLAVIFLQFGMAGMNLIAKSALNQGMNHYSFVVYRHIVAAVFFSPLAFFFERKVRPKMTIAIFAKITLLGLLEPAIDQNLYYLGMKYTTATFTAAMANTLPALTFLLAWIFRLEKMNMKIHGLAKLFGTIVTVVGAATMAMVRGPVLDLPWTKGAIHQSSADNSGSEQHTILKGGLIILAGCSCWASFVILQAHTLKSYPAELSLASLICLTGAIQGTAIALAAEWGNTAIWSIHLDMKLLAAVYTGIICSGFAFYINGVVMKERGPVFVTAFSPLSMVIVAIIGSFCLGEEMFLGRIIGAVVIVTGLYLVIWGKSKDQLPSDVGKLPIDHGEKNGSTSTENSVHAVKVLPMEVEAV